MKMGKDLLFSAQPPLPRGADQPLIIDHAAGGGRARGLMAKVNNFLKKKEIIEKSMGWSVMSYSNKPTKSNIKIINQTTNNMDVDLTEIFI